MALCSMTTHSRTASIVKQLTPSRSETITPKPGMFAIRTLSHSPRTRNSPAANSAPQARVYAAIEPTVPSGGTRLPCKSLTQPASFERSAEAVELERSWGRLRCCEFARGGLVAALWPQEAPAARRRSASAAPSGHRLRTPAGDVFGLPCFGADVARAGAHDAAELLLLQDVGRPSGHTGAGEHRGEQVRRHLGEVQQNG